MCPGLADGSEAPFLDTDVPERGSCILEARESLRQAVGDL